MRYATAVVLSLILGLNIFFHFFASDPITTAKIKSFSLSRGDRYYYTLRLWHLLANSGDWSSASFLAHRLDPADISYYLDLNSPQSLKKQLNSLTAKSDKTVEDWLELARIQIRLGKTILTINSLTRAQGIDPLRFDIDKMISQLRR